MFPKQNQVVVLSKLNRPLKKKACPVILGDADNPPIQACRCEDLHGFVFTLSVCVCLCVRVMEVNVVLETPTAAGTVVL